MTQIARFDRQLLSSMEFPVFAGLLLSRWR